MVNIEECLARLIRVCYATWRSPSRGLAGRVRVSLDSTRRAMPSAPAFCLYGDSWPSFASLDPKRGLAATFFSPNFSAATLFGQSRSAPFLRRNQHTAPPRPPHSLLAQVPAAMSRSSAVPGTAKPTSQSPAVCRCRPTRPKAPCRTSVRSGPTRTAPARSMPQ